jgi:hypothetical protein
MIRNFAFPEGARVLCPVNGVAPSSTTPAYVSLKGYQRCAIIISGVNGATVTGSAITLKQATAVANTGEKALGFSNMYARTDTTNTTVSTLTNTAVTSNTFTTNSTNSQKFLYVIDVKASDLDVGNSFDCLRAGTGDAVNSTLTVLYVLYNPRYEDTTPTPEPLID